MREMRRKENARKRKEKDRSEKKQCKDEREEKRKRETCCDLEINLGPYSNRLVPVNNNKSDKIKTNRDYNRMSQRRQQIRNHSPIHH